MVCLITLSLYVGFFSPEFSLLCVLVIGASLRLEFHYSTDGAFGAQLRFPIVFCSLVLVAFAPLFLIRYGVVASLAYHWQHITVL
jgi:hypothetical protein